MSDLKVAGRDDLSDYTAAVYRLYVITGRRRGYISLVSAVYNVYLLIPAVPLVAWSSYLFSIIPIIPPIPIFCA